MSTEIPLTYRQNPRPVGFEVAYRLAGDVLAVDNGRRETAIPLGKVAEVRLTYEARSMAQGAYQTKLKLSDGTTVKLTSLSWKGMMDVRRQDAEYSAFVQALLAGIARANPKARFIAGKPQLQWLAIAALSVASLAALAFFILQALLAGVIAAAGLWQLAPMVRLNRPQAFTPSGPRPALLP
jgi:hypothetical protein